MKINLLPFVFFLLCSSIINAQKISYSEPGANFDHTQFNIIGSIKNHIIVWEYFNNDYSTSKILVFDNDLKLLNKIKIEVISNRFASLDFINEKDSFDVIYQYVSNHTFFCKRLSFDENANNTQLETLKSYQVPADVIAQKDYRVIQSPDKKNFILLRSQVSEGLDKTQLSYILFANNKTRFDHSTALLYNIDSATSYIFSLDNANHFMVVASEGTENNKLLLYEINPGTGDAAGIEGTVKEGFLNMKSLNISNVNDQIFITAHWENKEHGIFVWQPDLYNFSAGKDTIYTEGIDSAFTLAKDEFLKTDVYPFNNAYNFLISVNHSFPYNRYPDGNKYFSSGYYPESSSQGNYFPGSFYDGRVNSVIPVKDQPNKGTVIGHDPNYSNNRDVSQSPWNSQQQYDAYSRNFFINTAVPYNRLLIYNIDKDRNLNWYKYFDSTLEDNFTSYISHSNIFYVKQLQLIYPKADKNNFQQMSLLNVNSSEEYKIEPVIVMKTSYKYISNYAKQISENAVLYPCTVRNKLAFIKVEAR